MPIERNTNQESRNVVVCVSCNDEIDTREDEVYNHNDDTYCESCHNRDFRECRECGTELNISENNADEFYSYRGDVLCEICFDESYAFCSNCDVVFHNDIVYRCSDDDELYCESCHDGCNCNDTDEDERRRIDTNGLMKDAKKSQLAKMSLTDKNNLDAFGIEIESIVKEEFSRRDKRLDYFSITHDGSLNCDGVEFVSSILKDYKPIKSFCGLAKDYLDIDKSCGFHIHLYIDKKFQTLLHIKKMLMAYYLSQEFWFKMVSRSRQNSHYCQKLKLNELNGYLMCDDMKQFESKFYSIIRDNISSYKRDKYFGKRYEWVNIHSIFHRNTIEIRSHNGTTNYKKITNWLSLHRTFLKFVLGSSQKKIYEKLQDFDAFKSLFNKKLRDYIDERVAEFENGKEDKEMKKDSDEDV